MDLETLISLIREQWPARFERGRILHVHRNDLELEDGSRVHLRIMVQRVADPPIPTVSDP